MYIWTVFLLQYFLAQLQAYSLIKRDSTQTYNISQIWDYSLQGEKIRGVSFGGWFVLEPYITPSLFEQFSGSIDNIPTDEYTFTEALGTEEAQRQLEDHWSTWYTEDDFEDAKKYGFNLIRIPLGYWAFELLADDPYVQGQEKYLDQGLEWASKYDLKVWIDLHGVPGSQNGFDNSGKRGNVTWQDDEENIEVTYDTLYYIFDKYGGSNYTDTIIGIEIVNEPLNPKLNMTEYIQFTYNVYNDFRDTYESENYFLLQDAFESIGYWNEHFNNEYGNVSLHYTNSFAEDGELPDDYFYGVVLDHHHYEVFTDTQVHNSASQRIQDIKNYASSIYSEQAYHPSLIGEWSAALTDCAKWLNGVGVGARYDGTYDADQLEQSYHGGIYHNDTDSSSKDVAIDTQFFSKKDSSSSSDYSCENLTSYANFSDVYKTNIRKFIEIQLLTYENNTAGWIFWNYKTENAIEWDFKLLSEKKLFPNPLDDYEYFYANGTEKTSETNSASSVYLYSKFIILLGSFIVGLL